MRISEPYPAPGTARARRRFVLIPRRAPDGSWRWLEWWTITQQWEHHRNFWQTTKTEVQPVLK